MMEKRNIPITAVLSLLLIAAVIAVSIYGIRLASRSQTEEAAVALENSLRRAAVSCYAIEGCYPPSLEYLTENYGVYIDGDIFVVHYEIFASNIMPEITVLSIREAEK
ncbi:MAG: hypothetical protein ACI3VB_03000 [Oscillospiraceae bacterium]